MPASFFVRQQLAARQAERMLEIQPVIFAPMKTMSRADFAAEGFYYNGGMNLLEPMEAGVVLKRAGTGGEDYYRLTHDKTNDRVYLVQSGSDEPADVGGYHDMRLFFHDCYPVSEDEQTRLGLVFPPQP